ncbi:MAG: hypothetical protein C0412_04325 [Flavobacterium sp.]|nr:hypothetical protein [Flavobacterium sp.]
MKELTPYQEAALDYSKHISLTANAGSGKTFVLAKRFVQIALNSNVPLNSIVAITFTDKAAGELNRKIANEIDERIKSEKSDLVLKRLERLRNQLVFANISTIHSFCINILKEFSPEAAIDADFIPIDTNTSDELIDLSIQDTLNEGFKNKDKTESIKYLIRYFGNKKNFESQIKSVVENRKHLLRFYSSVYTGTVEEIAGFYKNYFQAGFHKIFFKKLSNAPVVFRKINNAVLEKDSKNKKGNLIKSILDSYKFTDKIEILLDRFREVSSHALKKDGEVFIQGYLKEERDAFSNEISFLHSLFTELKNLDSITDDKITKELAILAKNFSIVFMDVNNKYELRKKQKGYLDFEDILLKTRDILQLAEVKDFLEKKYKFIMVDEYQDTNEIQYEIIMPILDNLNSGNLCVVGDEKQSIYMFRDADLEVFNRTKDNISQNETTDSILTLPHSFRLAPKIALFINHIFKNLFAEPDLMFNEVSHSELFCARADESPGQVEFILRENNDELLEADLVARKIIALYNKKEVISSFSDVLILCRKRNSFRELEEVFSKYRIPYTVVAGKGFFQKQTTLDIYNYLSFLLNRDNDAALLGILRAPFYSVSDTELFAISLVEGDTYFEKLLKYSCDNQNIAKVVNLLQVHLNEVNSHSFSSLIRQVLNDTSYWAVISNKTSAIQDMANIEKLISNARAYSLQGYKTLYDFVEHLKEAIDMLEDEGQADIIDNSDSVKIMTIHQSKGLESKAVFLFSANEKVRDSSVKAKSIAVDKKYGIIAKVPEEGNYFDEYKCPPITNLYNYISKMKNEAETKRLLYVALTRAVDYLCVSASHKEFNFEKGSFAKYLIDSAGIAEGDVEISIQDDLTRLRKVDVKFEKNVSKEEIIIPVLKHLEPENFEKPVQIDSDDLIEVLTGKIGQEEKNEFVSASKISVFKQCPYKYYLTYEIGFSKIYKQLKAFTENYEFNKKEDEESVNFAEIRGTIIHSLLEKNIGIEKVEQFVDETIVKRTSLDVTEKTAYEKMKNSIITDMRQFYSSETYWELQGYSRFKNEFEIYTSEDDYFLYGIVDKIVYEKGKIIIIDYKTDSIKKEEIKDRADTYFNQLKFYAYTISKNLKKDYEFETRLIFIKHPAKLVKRNYSHSELSLYRDELKDIVTRMRRGEFAQNLAHCPKCHLSDSNNICVKNENTGKIF